MYNTPIPSSNYGLNIASGDFTAITETTISSSCSALDVNMNQTKPIYISKDQNSNALANPIFVELSNGTTALNIDGSGNLTVNSLWTAPSSGINVNAPSSGFNVNWEAPVGGLEVVVNVPSSGLLVTLDEPIALSIPASGIPVNVLTNEDIKTRINNYQTTAVTKSSTAAMTHTNTASANISAWTVGSDADCTFSLKNGANTLMVSRTSAAQRQVQIMFPTALLFTGDITVSVTNEDPGDNAVAFSVINGYEG